LQRYPKTEKTFLLPLFISFTMTVSSVGSHHQLSFLLWTPYWIGTSSNTAFYSEFSDV